MRTRPVLLGLGLVAALALNAMDPAGKDEGPAQPVSRTRSAEAIEAGSQPSSGDAPAAASAVPFALGSMASGLAIPDSVPVPVPREMLFGPRRQPVAHALFEPRSWDPPAQPRQTEPVARPTAPPLPFRFVGRQWTDGGQEVFISAGNKVLIARAGEQLDGGFRIDAVEPDRILFTYLPLETSFQLQFGAP